MHKHVAALFVQPARATLRSLQLCLKKEGAQADVEQRKQEVEARYLSCTLLPAPDDAQGLAAFLATARPDPALCEPAAVLATCQALHLCAILSAWLKRSRCTVHLDVRPSLSANQAP